ncbi:hypothetical protein [Halarchaeum sp. P4]|uniref:hypothetical protein n=1 Tax=Halarchaeum sp. P4 TaxID=3421639 RepID=UPI003EBB9A94
MARRSQPSTSNRSAPLGVKIICALGALGVLVGVVGSFGLLASGSGLGVVLGLVTLGLSVGQAVVIVGLLNVQPWAWTWAMVLYGLSAVLDLLTVDLFALLVTLVIIAYLASVRDVYRAAR